MTTPTDVLRAEHQVILAALASLETAAARLAAGRELPAGWWEGLIDFLRVFADRNHHAKEEKSLFPALVKAGVPSEGGPVGVVLAEPEQGRALARGLGAAGGGGGCGARARTGPGAGPGGGRGGGGAQSGGARGDGTSHSCASTSRRRTA